MMRMIIDFLLAQRLQELHLQENTMEVLNKQALVGLASLALLDLSKNNLRTLSAAILEPLISLQVLRITGTMTFGHNASMDSFLIP